MKTSCVWGLIRSNTLLPIKPQTQLVFMKTSCVWGLIGSKVLLLIKPQTQLVFMKRIVFVHEKKFLNKQTYS